MRIDTAPRPRRTAVSVAISVVLVVTSCMAAAVVPVSPAAAATGTISGTVSRGTGGAFADGWVEVTSMDGRLSFGGPTNLSGAYSVSVDPGVYCVSVGADGNDVSLATHGGGTSCRNGATPVTVVSGGAVAGVDAVVHTGTLVGTVVADENGTPISGASVSATAAGRSGSGRDTTDGAGAFTIVDLLPGSYCVSGSASGRVRPTTGGPPKCPTGYLHAVVVADATSAPLAIRIPRADSPGVGAISGRVTVGGAPVAGRTVIASNDLASGQTTTAADGSYTIAPLPPGAYCVYTAMFDSTTVAPEAYADADSCATSTPVVVATSAVPGIDVALTAGGRITGTITGPGGTPALSASVTVTSFDVQRPSWRTDVATNSSGTYLTPMLPAGRYCVTFAAAIPNLAREAYLDAPGCELGAAPVTVTRGATVTANATLSAGGAISGTINVPPGVDVEELRVTGWGPAEFIGYAYPDAAGNFGFAHLTPGNYCVTVRNPGRNDIVTTTFLTTTFVPTTLSTTDTCNTNRGSIVVNDGATTSLDLTPPLGGTISGFVITPDGFPVGNPSVEVATADGTRNGRPERDGQRFDGSYSLRGVPVGTWCVVFESNAEGIGSVVYGAADSCARGQLVTVTAGLHVGNIDLLPPPVGRVSGTLHVPAGTPLPEYTVDLVPVGSQPAASITRTFDLPFFGTEVQWATDAMPGTYCVVVTPSGRDLSSRAHTDVPACDRGASSVTVRASEYVEGVDVTLHTSTFVPLAAPVRLMDTRAGEPTVDGQAAGQGAVAGGTVRELQVAGRGGIPADATSAVLNVTAVGGGSAGFLTVFPCGGTRPTASNLNWIAGQITPNAVVTKLGTGGTVCVFAQTTVDVVVDISGHIPRADTFTALDQPARLMDTRPGEPTVDGQAAGGGPIGGGTVRELQVTGRAGVPATSSVVLNVTAVNGTGPGFVTVYPCGGARPTASNLNITVGQVTPNAVVTRVGTDGMVCVFAQTTVDVVVDISGHVPSATTFTPLPQPARLMDTRLGEPTIDGQAAGIGKIVGGSVRELVVAGRGGVPANAASAVLNVTAVGATGPGFLTVYPCGAPRPTASNLNVVAGRITPNAVFTRIGANGTVCVFAQTTVDVVVDISGSFLA